MNHTPSILIQGDIIGSKKEPLIWVDKLSSALDQLNQRYASAFTMPFSIVAGDGFGAVVNDLADAVTLVQRLQGLLAPVEVRVVIVCGEINQAKADNFNELHGDALLVANRCINQLKKTGKHFSIHCTDEALGLAIEGMINLIFALRKDWSVQAWATNAYHLKGCKQKEIAEALGITQQYVSKLMIASNMRLIHTCQADLLRLIALNNGG
ncbi:SatD family protein [Suttonella sp. R2A3]|uniref:SatD family protein n=1 Tax=Suttonella sp. R2A3 TaxID=2908648 RepID=UPI001F207D1E|nr:SatD family protein [Suttonella sp. R2A3]UJF23932.1 SatD family protein [Suttonella sp. R2A3]